MTNRSQNTPQQQKLDVPTSRGSQNRLPQSDYRPAHFQRVSTSGGNNRGDYKPKSFQSVATESFSPPPPKKPQ